MNTGSVDPYLHPTTDTKEGIWGPVFADYGALWWPKSITATSAHLISANTKPNHPKPHPLNINQAYLLLTSCKLLAPPTVT